MVNKIIVLLLLLGGLMPVASAEIDKKLIQAYEAKGSTYQPRTQHLEPDGRPQFINSLILENSPYLLQHAHNPVDWYPWGADAFEAAKEQDKPIFLSIGYSTCHWCHVMEQESFDNVDIAKMMNESFINIKVDREQRPEIDELYMTAVQIMTGHGGWPMSSFLTSEGKSFWGGTYFPPEQFKQLILGINEAWLTQRPQVEQQANQITAAVTKASETKRHATKLDSQVGWLGVSQIMSSYDELQGGFSQAPKFPNEPNLLLLLDHVKRHDDAVVLEAIETTLDAMARGGIYDHVGGGFHRYAVDNAWLVPHFEKMLYNQAYLSRVYLEAYELTRNPVYKRAAKQTLDYVLRDMTSANGGFYSATDADSEGEEGTYFVWTLDEINTVLAEDDVELAVTVFGITQGGNFEGKNILHLSEPLSYYAKELNIDETILVQRLDKIIEQLRQVRQQRIPPLRDEKVLTAWNAMMISSLVLASEVLGEHQYLVAAEKNAIFLLKNNQSEQGMLWRVHLDGQSAISGTQEDYAYFAEALLALYDQTQNKQYLDKANELTQSMLSQFWDEAAGGFYMDGVSDVPIMARVKQSTDSAIPAGNAVAYNVLVMLANRMRSYEYSAKAAEAIAAFSDSIARYPSAYSYFVVGLNKQRSGEVSHRQYAAHGIVSATVDMQPKSQGIQLIFTIDIAEGWHINAHKPLDKDLIATTLKLSDIMSWQLDSVIYPDALHKELGFSQKVLALYDKQISIVADASSTAKPATPIVVELNLQACSEQICLAPETMRFKLFH